MFKTTSFNLRQSEKQMGNISNGAGLHKPNIITCVEFKKKSFIIITGKKRKSFTEFAAKHGDDGRLWQRRF